MTSVIFFFFLCTSSFFKLWVLKSSKRTLRRKTDTEDLTQRSPSSSSQKKEPDRHRVVFPDPSLKKQNPALHQGLSFPPLGATTARVPIRVHSLLVFNTLHQQNITKPSSFHCKKIKPYGLSVWQYLYTVTQLDLKLLAKKY